MKARERSAVGSTRLSIRERLVQLRQQISALTPQQWRVTDRYSPHNRVVHGHVAVSQLVAEVNYLLRLRDLSQYIWRELAQYLNGLALSPARTQIARLRDGSATTRAKPA